MSRRFTLPDSSTEGKHKAYGEHKRKASQAWSRQSTTDVNNISPIPLVENPERREACKRSLKLYCETYFPNRFNLRWAPAHLELIDRIEKAILAGGVNACYAFPRGMGKTSVAEVAAMWAQSNGYSRYVVPIAAKASLAHEILQSIVQEYETNDTLAEDFPEICTPVRAVERKYVRAKGQHVDDAPTRWEFTPGKGVFTYPVVEGSECSGSIIHAFGITGTFRGLKHLLPTGEVIRPDLVLIDDPQTDKSAKSETTTSTRERVIDGAIRGLAGPKRSITAIMPCTVIRPNDLAERFLDREKRPEWQGHRTKMLLSFPTNMDLWNEYNDIRKQSLRSAGNIVSATDYYINNRVEMDEGAEVSWTERFDERKEVSAIQSAMNLFFEIPLTFASEYQNEPLVESQLSPGQIELNQTNLLNRVIGLNRGIVPASTQYVTTGIDVQKNILFYMTVAWSPDFGGVICDYGTYPRQPSFDGWVASTPVIPLVSVSNVSGIGPNIYRGLSDLHNILSANPLKREGTNETVPINRTLIDAGWAESSNAVFNFCRDACPSGSDLFLPSIGRGVGASMIPFAEWQLKQGEIRKWNSRILPRSMKSTLGRHASFDGNIWKTLIAERLSVPMGGSNGLFLHGPDPTYHQTLALHLTSEKAEIHEGRGRKVHEWYQKDKHSDNHWWDCLVLSAVAANLAGLEPHSKTVTIGELTYSAPDPKKVRKKIDYSKLPKVEL